MVICYQNNLKSHAYILHNYSLDAEQEATALEIRSSRLCMPPQGQSISKATFHGALISQNLHRSISLKIITLGQHWRENKNAVKIIA